MRAISGNEFSCVATTSLPVFVAPDPHGAVFRTPGHIHLVPACAVQEVARLVRALANGSAVDNSSFVSNLAHEIVRLAKVAETEASTVNDPTRFESLIVYLTQACNLRCTYCFAADRRGIDEGPLCAQAVRGAARIVAADCAAAGRPFILGIQGGGEPTLDQDGAERVLTIVYEEASQGGVPTRSYIATNGVMPEAKVEWLAARFNLVGVSCDGPREIHDRHRPGDDQRRTYVRVARTMRILKECRCPFLIRVTLTRRELGCQAEIVEHLITEFGPQEIRIEPVYRAPSVEAAFESSVAETFAAEFIKAQEIGHAHGVPVSTSLSRPGEQYGRYCSVVRHTLSLTRDGTATACFLAFDREATERKALKTGGPVAVDAGFAVDNERIRTLAKSCNTVPGACDTCFCRFQCTYACPDRCCLYSADPRDDRPLEEGLFRCHANRALQAAMIRAAARRTWGVSQRGRRIEVRDYCSALNVVVDRRFEGIEYIE